MSNAHSTTARLAWLHHRSLTTDAAAAAACLLHAHYLLCAATAVPRLHSPSPCLSQRLSRQRILGAAPSPSLPDHTRQHPLLATQTSAVATTTCLDYLRLLTYPNDAPIHGLADIRLPVLPTDIGAAPSPLAPRPDTHDSTTLATQTPSLPANYLHASPFDARRSTRIHLAAAPFRASRT